MRVGVGIRVVAADGSPVVGARAEVLDDAGMSAHEAWSGAHGDVPLPETLDGRVTGIRVTHPDFAVAERTVCLSRGLSPTIVLASGCLVRLRLTGESRGSSGRLRFAVERPGVNQAECLACHKPLYKTSYTFTIDRLTAVAKAR